MGEDYSPGSVCICRRNLLRKSKTLLYTNINKLIEIEKGLWTYGISNECLRNVHRRPLAHLTYLFNRCLQLTHFAKSRKQAKVITLPKPDKDRNAPQNLLPISLLSTTGKLFEEVILRIIQRHFEERGMLNAN
jgi:hypothetical protein